MRKIRDAIQGLILEYKIRRNIRSIKRMMERGLS